MGMTMTRSEALEYCTKRWIYLVDQYPTMASDVPLDRYVYANLAATMRLRPSSELSYDELCTRMRALG